MFSKIMITNIEFYTQMYNCNNNTNKFLTFSFEDHVTLKTGVMAAEIFQPFLPYFCLKKKAALSIRDFTNIKKTSKFILSNTSELSNWARKLVVLIFSEINLCHKNYY